MSSVNLYIDCLDNSELSEKYAAAKPKTGDVGVDLFCVEEIVVPAHGQATLDFKIVCKCESYNGSALIANQSQTSRSDVNQMAYYLYPRSSISKTPLRMSNSVGIIDAGYRGHIMAKVDNISDTDFVVKAGERYFQICVPLLITPTVVLAEVNDVTERGTGGFGSTGR